MTAWITAAGTSQFGKQRDKSISELAWTAIGEAFDDLDATAPPRIDAVYVGNVFGEPGIAVRAVQGFGITEVPVFCFENACASGSVALHEARIAIETGRFEQVLVLGIEAMTGLFTGPISPQQSDAEGRSGLAMPALYAMSASRWLAEDRVTVDQLAAVSVKNHAHALFNPRAQYSGSYDIAQVLASPMISDPLTLLQCSPLSDGAAAVVVSAHSTGAQSVKISATEHRSGKAWDHRSDAVWGYDIVRATATAAYDAAAIPPTDVDFAEIHDAFTIGELVTTEALRLAPEGAAGRYALGGTTALGGSLPINPSGGLLSRGHPLGATGVAQAVEAVWQLRGDAGGRQVDGARRALTETMGGGVSGSDGNSCVVSIFERNEDAA
ncbi:thiolase family protein [Gordonia rubripertincta]|uniref:propanoyl-CoA C-acyltransferase n=1 Tax=Gordonia rubripertincta TaxID=36822 RepID=A0ABT4MZM1_GORRU|nr:thiolase family protein [Gordonia rubripertincta]MCZ4552448.1 thiolase family protein [Gordonia rubripertincta]